MSEEEKNDNKKYSGDFTRVPNILFASYRHLTKEEKFLYCTLRQVYWDTKPRYVSLRELAELTQYSTGALSKMLPRLTLVGLIHAEIRREKKAGKEQGNAKYYITISDIWESNKRFYSCSPNEQVDPSEILVHQMIQACSPNDTSLFTKTDKLVHQMNKFELSSELAKKDKDILKERIKDIDTYVVSATQNDASLTFHPLHNFIALDNPISPKTMIVYLTSKAYESEMEDDRRAFVAQEVKYELEQQGHTITYKWERTKEAVVINADKAEKIVSVLKSFREGNETEQQATLKVLIDAGIIPPANENDNHSHSSAIETSSQAQNSTSLPQCPLLPVAQAENASVSQETHNSTPTSENGSQVALSQASDEIRIADDATPQKLIDVPLGPPAMPLDSAKWNAETLVDIVEAKIGSRFSEKLRGARSQRYRQLEAAKKIIAVQVTREEFVSAYDDRNDNWWRSNKGKLTVEDMAANTPRRVMRVLEVMESVEAKAGKLLQFPSSTPIVAGSQAERNREIYTGYDFTDLESQFYPTDAQKRAHAAQG